MGKIKLLNTNNNSYFENNQIDISDSIPTEGNHIVGDIVIKETQVEHMAIGWICIEAGNPGVWAEFGGMFDEPIVLDPESVGMNELNSEVKSKLLLGDSIVINVQALQSAVANCATKDDLKNIDLSIYATKEDLNNIDISETVGELSNLETEDKSNLVNAINEVNFDIINAVAYIEDVEEVAYDNKYYIGDTNTLVTEDKTNLVAAINEVFQSGVNVKQNLVDALIAKGIECSTSNTFEELIIKVNELSLNPFSEWAKANCWLAAGSCTALPATTYAATAQAYKGKIYVIGGYGTTTAVRVYDPKYNTWATTGFAAMPTGRYGLDSTIIDDKIYCIGGYNNLTTNQVYDITNNKWTTLAVMPTGREYLTVDAVGTNIYAIGGSGSSTYLNTNQCYDTLTNTWTTKTTMTAAKYDHASEVIGTDVYCISGYTGSAVGTNYKYSTTTDTWTTMKAATARRAACCNNIEDKLYYNHGSNASTTYYANNYMYDPVANTWTTMTTGITASKAKYRTSAVVNNMMFVFGGYNGSALNLVDCYIV